MCPTGEKKNTIASEIGGTKISKQIINRSGMFGPNVTVATAGHPILPSLREKAYQFNKAVHIGKNCWIGAGCVIIPGVTIGDNTVIGAGSVVTRDIPPSVVALGVPCRVVRGIGEHDKEFYYKTDRIPDEIL